MPAMAGKGGVAETVSTSGTSAQTTNTARRGWYASVKNQDASQLVWAIAGNNPTAAANTGFAIAAGERRDIGPLEAGDKIAFING